MAEPSETALIHFYRGELGRMTIYRVRLDTTTNWAIGVDVAVTTFALGTPSAPHIIMALPYLLTAVFLFLEARRFQELEVFRGRIRAVECGFFAKAFKGEPRDDQWTRELVASLQEPEPPLSIVDAMAHRVRRNYFWLFMTVYAAWWLKLWLSDAPLVQAAAFAGVSGYTVIGVSVLLLVPLMLLPFRASRARRA